MQDAAGRFNNFSMLQRETLQAPSPCDCTHLKKGEPWTVLGRDSFVKQGVLQAAGCIMHKGGLYLQIVLNLDCGTPQCAIMASSSRRWLTLTTKVPICSSVRISSTTCIKDEQLLQTMHTRLGPLNHDAAAAVSGCLEFASSMVSHSVLDSPVNAGRSPVQFMLPATTQSQGVAPKDAVGSLPPLKLI